MEETLAHLINTIRDHPTADFYRAAWGDASVFGSLPAVSRADMAATALGRRQYKEGGEMTKIIRTPDYSFLSMWSVSDIGAEPYGVASSRPMSYFADPGEAIEKSIWCYERNMVPLIGEQNPYVALLAARAYDIDSLIADTESVRTLMPYLEARKKPLTCISVVGQDFSPAMLSSLTSYAQRVRFVLALPETGAFAESTPEIYPTFSVLPNCVLEEKDGLVLTKVAHLVTPIIRYKTGLRGLHGKKDGTRTFALT